VERKIHAIVLAGGTGERIGIDIPKQFIRIGGKTLLEYSIEIFEKHPAIDDIIIVINPSYRFLCEQIIIKNGYKKISKILNGGSTRRESSFIGLKAIENDDDLVLIHDAVRPFLSSVVIDRVVKALDSYEAVDTAIHSDDTIIKIQEDRLISEIPNRKFMMRGQTPQGFKVGLIKKAHTMALEDKELEVTDDCGLIIRYNLSPIFVVEGDRFNIKVTYPEDLYLADKIFQVKSEKVKIGDTDINLRLKNKIIIIFGASRGIGKEIFNTAKMLGAKVYGFSRSNGVDVRDYNSIINVYKNVLEKEKRIDFIVNTAGVLKTGILTARKEDSILEEMTINFLGAVNVVKAAASIIKSEKLSILLFASSSYTRGRPLYSIYSASKAAVVNFMQAASDELRDKNIFINVLNPERTATPMRYENFGPEPENELLSAEFVAKVALKILCSDITGQVIDVRKHNFS